MAELAESLIQNRILVLLVLLEVETKKIHKVTKKT
jgi:hypothetical protein